MLGIVAAASAWAALAPSGASAQNCAAASQGYITLNGGKSGITVSVSARKFLYNGAYFTTGSASFTGVSGPVGVIVSAPIVNITTKPVLIASTWRKQALMKTGIFWFSDLSHYKVGDASTIVRYQAFAVIDTLANGSTGMAGFKIYKAEDINNPNAVPTICTYASSTGNYQMWSLLTGGATMVN